MTKPRFLGASWCCFVFISALVPAPEFYGPGPSPFVQTHAPSSVTPSAAAFFGLMNCSRETPSHIARRFWGRLIQTQLPGAPGWKPAIFNADWTLIKSDMDEYKICSGRRYLGVSYLIATRAASARNPERVSPCLRAYSSIFASSKRGKVILTFSAGPK